MPGIDVSWLCYAHWYRAPDMPIYRYQFLYRIRNGLVAIPAAAYLEPLPTSTRRFETRYVQIQWAKVYERSGAGNWHFCDLLAKIEDHINMILNLFFTGNAIQSCVIQAHTVVPSFQVQSGCGTLCQ